MNLISKLLELDKGKLETLPTAQVESKRLSEMIGEPAVFTVRAIPGDRYMEISSMMVGKSGKPVYGKAYDTNALIAIEGIVSPDLKNPELMQHFGCATPKDLVKKLFLGGEITKIADKIAELSGFEKEEEMEDEIKNS